MPCLEALPLVKPWQKMLIYKEISEFLFKPAKLNLSAVSVSGKFAFVEYQQEDCI